MKKIIRLGGLLLLCLLGSAAARAQLTVQPTVSSSSGLFNYSYNVSNQTAFDFSVITLSGLFSAPDAVQNLTAPSGYLASFDPGLSLLSFLEGNQAFLAGQTINGFSFDSPYAPAAGSFEAIDVTGGIQFGLTSVPGSLATPVPEPSTTALAGALVLIGLVVSRKISVRKSNQK